MIRTVSDILGDFWRLYEAGGLPRGESTGWPSMDPFYTIRAGEWTLVTGIPGHGKSSWLDNVIVNTARDKDWKWLVFSAENQPAARHAAGLAAIYIGRPFQPGYGRMTQEDWLYAGAFLDTQIQFLEPEARDCNIDTLLTVAETRPIQALLIDPWNELDHSRPTSMTETEYISASLSKVRRFAREQNVHVFIVAHPAKLIRAKGGDGDNTTYPVPTAYDVAGSAHWRNKADNVVCIWRDVLDPRSEIQVHVQKIRFREVGQVGLCKLYFDRATGRFIDPLIGARSAFSAKDYGEMLDQGIARHEAELVTLTAELAVRRGREPGEDG